jgi:hypothetical protein
MRYDVEGGREELSSGHPLTFLAYWVLGALVISRTLGRHPAAVVLLPTGFVGGLLFGPINPIGSTVIQGNTPPQTLGGSLGRCRLNPYASRWWAG